MLGKEGLEMIVVLIRYRRNIGEATWVCKRCKVPKAMDLELEYCTVNVELEVGRSVSTWVLRSCKIRLWRELNTLACPPNVL